MKKVAIRKYNRVESVVFLRTGEAFGGLSNMAGGYPININGVRFLTSEALYQACRFPHLPEVQKLIIGQNSPMTAKMRSKPFRAQSRDDWMKIRVRIMKWCIRAKLLNNWQAFSELLLSTEGKSIVEESRRDSFWGALPLNQELLEGANVLGRLLMELREDIISTGPEGFKKLAPPEVENFIILEKAVPTLELLSLKSTPVIQDDIFSGSH
ncbi:NADAR family protein [Pseudomonas fluorescens]|nr:NADAR family protein [Pseudomonas fluorescens]